MPYLLDFQGSFDAIPQAFPILFLQYKSTDTFDFSGHLPWRIPCSTAVT